MELDRSAELVEHFIAEAHLAARARRWLEVLDRTEDVLVLDRDNRDAMALRTLAERHVGQSGPGADRRHETVLFADLVSSTTLTNRFDQEFVLRLIRSYELACTPVLTGLGGHVHRFVGDGILASFGYPTSHEDDARRAVQAGLDLIAAVASTSAQYADVGVDLQTRIGIASGVLVHADRGTGIWQQAGDLFGPAVNLAARLHEVARPDTICISAATARLVDGYFELDDLGAHPLKGFDAPVRAYAVVKRTSAGGWVDRHGPPVGRYVGRDAELAEMHGRWADLIGSGDADVDRRAPGPVSIFISGEPGIGKSRLVRQFVDTTFMPARTVIELQCAAYRTATPLHPVAAAIERRCGFASDDDDATLLAKLGAFVDASSLESADALPYLATLLNIDLSDSPARPEVSAAQLREATLGHLQRWITGIAARHPAVLVVEDLHWADPSTRELLQRITTSPPTGLLTIATSRTPPPWAQEPEFARIALSPLPPDETRAMVEEVAEAELSPTIVAEVARRSDGIPLYIEQLVDSLNMSDGAPLGSPGSIPLELTELLQARLDATGSSKRVAQLAATVGREFDPAMVEAVAERLHGSGELGSLDGPVRHHLDRLIASNLVETDPDDIHRLRFRHALVGDAAYESQLLEERPARHHALARLLLERDEQGGISSDPAVVAHHFERAERPVEAIVQYLEAANRGQATGAFAEASANLARADGLLLDVDDDARAGLELAVRLSRGLTVCSTDGFAAQGVIEDFARAVELCDELREDRAAAQAVIRALLGLWSYYTVTGDLVAADEITTSVERQVERVTTPGGRPCIHLCRGVERFYAGDIAGAVTNLQDAVVGFADDPVDLMQWSQPNDPVAGALAFLGPALLISGDERAGLAASDAGVARSGELAFPLGPFSVAFVRMYESWMHRLRGDAEAALRAADEVIGIGLQHGFVDWMMTGRIHRAAAVAANEPTRPALDEMGDAIAQWRAIGGRLALPALLVEQGWGYVAIGDVGRAARCADEAEALAGGSQRFGFTELHRLRAELAAMAGADAIDIERELLIAMRAAQHDGAHLFVVRCGMTYEHRLGRGRLPPDLQWAVDHSCARFGADALGRVAGGAALSRRGS